MTRATTPPLIDQNGIFKISVENRSAGSLSEALTIGFIVIRGGIG